MIKKTLFAAAVISAFFVVTSCSRINDLKIDALEKSIDKLEEKYKDLSASEIDKLEEKYKDLSASEIENAIELCQKQLDALLELGDDGKLSMEQKKTVSNLEGRFHRVLLKVQLYLMVNDVLDESGAQSLIEYIKGLLGADK